MFTMFIDVNEMKNGGRNESKRPYAVGERANIRQPKLVGKMRKKLVGNVYKNRMLILNDVYKVCIYA